jgi:hypothetical protein
MDTPGKSQNQHGNSNSSNGEHDSASAYQQQRLADGRACRDAALRYLKLGWSPLSLCPPDHVGVGREHSKKCNHPGKVPWHLWKEFQDRRPTEEEIRDWWRRQPNANVGTALGPISGLIRVDVDGAAGEAALQAKSGGDLPDTLEFRSGRKDGTGRGLLYRIPDGVELRTTPEPITAGAELRFQAKGAETVLPPSRHKDGPRYEWVSGHGPDDIEPAIAPAWVVRELQATTSSSKGTTTTSAGGKKIPEGGRNTSLTSLAGTMRRRGMTVEAITAALLAENEARCDPPLPEDEVRGIAQSVGRYPPAADAYAIILAYLRETLRPIFRRRGAIYSEAQDRDIRMHELVSGAPIELINRLEKATNAPKGKKGKLGREGLPALFGRWAPSAVRDLFDSLPEESAAAEVSELAQEEFRTELAKAMKRTLTLGFCRKDQHERQETRTIISWCRLLVTGQTWADVRGRDVWSCLAKDGRTLRVALRVELFSQIGFGGPLAGLTQKKFSALCELYDCGISIKVSGGNRRAVELSTTFIDDLRAIPEPDSDADGRTDADSSRARAHAREPASERPSTHETL